jgi:hypothetical protein
MNKQDRLTPLAPLTGALFVILTLGGVALGSQPMVTITDPTSKIIATLSDHAGTGAWVGAYMELASLAAFAGFAAGLFGRRRGPLATAGLIAAGVYIATTVVALVAGDVIRYGAHHGIGHQQMLTLFDLQSGLYFASWGIAGAFLALAPATGWLRRSATPIAGLLLIAMAVPTTGAAQLPNMLFLLWTIVASVSFTRRPRPVPAGAPAVASA